MRFDSTLILHSAPINNACPTGSDAAASQVPDACAGRQSTVLYPLLAGCNQESNVAVSGITLSKMGGQGCAQGKASHPFRRAMSSTTGPAFAYASLETSTSRWMISRSNWSRVGSPSKHPGCLWLEASHHFKTPLQPVPILGLVASGWSLVRIKGRSMIALSAASIMTRSVSPSATKAMCRLDIWHCPEMPHHPQSGQRILLIHFR